MAITDRVAALCEGTAVHLDGALRARVEAVEAALRAPLRVAVAGRVNSGKSTLVNALLGRQIAPTSVTECTRYVTSFQHGAPPDRVDIVLRDGTIIERQLIANRLPERLDLGSAEVARLDVWLSIERLRSFTIIDTPGLGSLDASRTRARSGNEPIDQDSRRAIAAAEALVFVLNDSAMADDQQALRDFRAASASARNSDANALGILSKADQVGGGTDPWPTARRLAERQANDLRAEVAAVVPLMGLLAEATVAGVFREADAAALRALADLDGDAQSELLHSVDYFRTADAPVSRADRERLLSVLDLYGVREGINLVKSGISDGPDLRAELEKRSGFPVLRDLLEETFGQWADALKTKSALMVLEDIAYSPDGDSGVLAAMLDQIEMLRLDPDLHLLRELEAHRAIARETNLLPASLVNEVRRLFSRADVDARLGLPGASSADLERAATDGIARWQAFGNTSSNPMRSHVARIVNRSYELLWNTLRNNHDQPAHDQEARP